MSVLVVGISHHSAPIDLLERVALDNQGADALARQVHSAGNVEEAMVLATCNRLEVVVEASTFHGAVSEIGELLCELSGLDHDQLSPHLYVHHDERAVAHLFNLACGLDSMAVGESQILGQLRAALAAAQRDARLGPALNPLLQKALRVGKRAHAETSIDEVSRSLVTLGLDQARQVLGDLTEVRTVVLGAGAMSGLAVATLVRDGITDVTVVNRTGATARRLADRHGVRAAGWPEMAARAGSADLLITTTGAVGQVLDAAALAQARLDAGRTGAPQVVLDLALPRDIDPEVGHLAGVHLWGLAELQAEAEHARPATQDATQQAQEQDALAAVRDLVTAEVAGYLTERRAARIAPTLAALRSRAAKVVDAEMARLDQRLPHLPEDERAEVRRTVQRVVDKLLHTPSVRARQLQSVDTGGVGDYGHALRELFDLDPHDIAVVSSPPPDIAVVSSAPPTDQGGAR
ncbi:glutamyl-tRNA reductase [Ornithinimicrobium sufpigmenti]|uniref:glutamyl-tRNA reductase n=1 Tax=Ornithinimicrobium sufpigmenti TaxID=2508882 RepID=UPI0010366425|nr:MULTISPECIES: glutamyl-tRNA reductase [unclassified Ornithinimicrobium]